MTVRATPTIFILYAVATTLTVAAAEAPIPPRIDFNRDVRPILSENCFFCHGPDKSKRKADLRLDTKEGLFAPIEGKRYPVVAGKPESSEVYQRLIARDDADRMPDPKSGKHLSDRQIAVIKKWIEQGAPYKGHWAYEKPVRAAVPDLQSDSSNLKSQVRNPIDAFLLAKLRQQGLGFSRQADRVTLIRRLYFDLLGLPPTPAQVDAFVNDRSPDAYEKLVESLLANPHFGERMAVYWLDLVRFADTIGYHSDNPRDITPYRDWVINAFNANEPFDQFTIEQLAGDLLPGPTLEQKVASGYNRLLQTTEEGGAQPKEYAAKYLADRVRNYSSVWLAGTMACCECHDHKYDPFTTRDFYSMEAFFADVRETPVGHREPGMPVPDAKQAVELARLDRAIAATRKALPTAGPRLLAGRVRRIATWLDLPKTEYLKKVRRSLVTVAEAPRTLRVLRRGNWQDDGGDVVTPAVPRFLGRIPTSDSEARPTRLDLAKWTVSRDNPLTARVVVNRLWRMFFGIGISKSLEDFGSQGEWPTHPELLDWLACEFMETSQLPGEAGSPRPWDVKHMVRLIVTSTAYRQTSYASPKLMELDPFNRLVARQGRFRLDAEFVRDNALSVAGLLVDKIGGESVKPYQPDGYWDFLNFPKRTYQADHGESQYRRGLYTHWQRTFPHPSLVNFDAPSREECTAERTRSNTPQQALTLLNDPTYVEAARVFAQRIVRECDADVAGRLRWAWRMALGRPPRVEELQVLADLYAKHKREYAQDPKAAEALVSAGEAPRDKSADVVELAAWTSVSRAILNLHETITRN